MTKVFFGPLALVFRPKEATRSYDAHTTARRTDGCVTRISSVTIQNHILR